MSARDRDEDVDQRFARFCEAYGAMADSAKYRPAAPSDGCGGISLSKAALGDREILKQEASKYAAAFRKEDDAREFYIGCSNFDTNRALVYVIEAARQLCGGNAGNATALRLLKMAIDEIKAVLACRQKGAA